MNDGPTFRNGPDYRDLRSPDGRLFVAPHVAQQPGEPPAYLMPARALTISRQSLQPKPKVYHPAISVFALQQPVGLIFLPTAEELEIVGEQMIEMAREMRSAAAAEAEGLIERVRKGGDR